MAGQVYFLWERNAIFCSTDLKHSLIWNVSWLFLFKSIILHHEIVDVAVKWFGFDKLIIVANRLLAGLFVKYLLALLAGDDRGLTSHRMSPASSSKWPEVHFVSSGCVLSFPCVIYRIQHEDSGAEPFPVPVCPRTATAKHPSEHPTMGSYHRVRASRHPVKLPC